MTLLFTAVRRLLLLVLLSAAAGATWAWWRDRDDGGLAPAEWPPIEPSTAPSTSSEPAAVVDAALSTTTDRAPSADVAWVQPDADGSCPLGHPIKANETSGIFHVPGGRFYDRTRAERCYSDDEAAVSDGYRRAKH